MKDLQKAYKSIVVEGVGGLLVPINRNYFVLDLAKELGLPLIVVSRPGLRDYKPYVADSEVCLKGRA